MADVSFNVANPYQVQLEELARRQKMAEIMQQQAFQPIQRSSYQGIEAPISPLSGIAKALQMYMGGRAQKDISEEKKALGERYKTESSDILGKAFEAGAGTPAIPGKMVAETSFAPSGSDLTDVGVARVPEGQAGAGNIVQPAYTVPGQAAVPPNSQKMAQLLMTSPDPAHKAFGLQEMQKNLQMQRFMNAGNAGNVPAAPVAAPTAAPISSGMPGAAPAAPAPQVAAPTTPQAAALSLFGGPAGGQSMAVWMQIDPSGKAYTEQLAKDYTDQNKPTDKIRELRAAGIPENSDAFKFALTDTATQGGIWRRDPITGALSLAPGYAKGQGDVTSATEKAKSESAISTREVGGRNVSGTDRQFKVLFTGEADTDQEAQSVTTWAARNGINVKIQGPRPQAIGTPQGPGGNVAVPIAGGIKNLTQAEIAGSRTTAEGRAKNEVAREEQLLRTGYQESQSMLNNLDVMESLSANPNVAQGKLADQISGLKSIGQSLGIRTEGLPAEEVITAISVEMSLKAKNQGGTNLMPGAMAVAETRLLQSMSPQLAQSKDGRDLLIQILRQKALRDQKISELATEYYDRNGKLDYNFEKQVREYAKANPMFTPAQIKLYEDARKRIVGQK